MECGVTDSRGFEDFCRHHYSGVARFAFLLTGDRQEALDLTQEGFARAFERWGRVSGLDRPEAWVLRVVANLGASWLRRRRRIILVAAPPETAVPVPEVPDPGLAKALDVLTARQRTVIVLRFYLDWSVASVADALGAQPGTVRALTAQGMQRLRQAFKEGEFSHEARR
jgi:RNA polymerase sigma-70 factor (sigma-E family)